MSKAVISPVCEGTGVIKKHEDKPCHGCSGKGWVEVGSEPVPYYPQPHIPWPPPYYYDPLRVTWTWAGDTTGIPPSEA